MKVGSLFSGIGGIELGLERSGMEIVWQVEKEKYARKVLEKHWPHTKRFEDILEVGIHNLEPVDIICGGFPCQPHSLAGKRKASEDERDLWGEFARIICELKPRWVVAENVPGLLSSESGRFFGRVLRDLAEIGYDAEWDCIPAAAFGAPHLRYRVFIVAHSNGTGGRFQQIAGEKFEDKTNAHNDGEKKSMADTQKPRLFPSRLDKGEEGCSCGGRSCNGGIQTRGIEKWWEFEPDVGRVAPRVPSRVDRLRCLGNAVVPQVAEWVGRQIMEFERGLVNGN